MKKRVNMLIQFPVGDAMLNDVEFVRRRAPFGYQDGRLTPVLMRLLKAKPGDKVLISVSKRPFKSAKSLTVRADDSRFYVNTVDLKVARGHVFEVCHRGFTRRFGKPVDGSKLYYTSRVVK